MIIASSVTGSSKECGDHLHIETTILDFLAYFQ